MTEQDPRPLKSVGETPAELVHALRALAARRDRDRARLARVADRLQRSIATPSLPCWQDKLGGGKLLLVGLAIGASMYAYSRLEARTAAERKAPAAVSVETHPAQSSRPRASAATAPLRAQPSEAIASAVPPAPPRPRAAPPAVASTPKRRRAARAQPPAPAATADAPAPAKLPAVEPSIAPRAPARAAETFAPAAPPASARVELARSPAPAPAAPRAPEPETLAAAPRLSEVAILQRARAAVSQQPMAALELLREHTDRFPSGMLAPERELLTIEALQGLGRKAEAARRQQQFEARYPRSIYSRRLQLARANEM